MKWIVRVMIALLTFLVGVVSSQLWSAPEREVVETRTIRAMVFDTPPVISLAQIKWRRIVVKDRFSFDVPSYLNDDGHSADHDLAVGAFRKPSYDMSGLFHIYYLSHEQAEQDPTTGPDVYKATTRADIIVDGKRGHMLIEFPSSDEVWSIKQVPQVKVYFPDIGGGRSFYMTFAAGFDSDGIQVAHRVINSIKFADTLPSHVDWRRKN